MDQPADSHIKHADSLRYWNTISADVNGMLGGYPQISRIDLQGSTNFIRKVNRLTLSQSVSSTDSDGKSSGSATKKMKLGVDCGAGIGRVTEGCLTRVCEVVDIVEPVAKFADKLATSSLQEEGKIGQVFVTGLEDWDPNAAANADATGSRYDLIWNQWCLGHLTDAQLEAYLGRAKKALTEDTGWIGVKENINTGVDDEDGFDDLDSSVTRSDASFKRIFENSGLVVVKTELQTGFPKGLGLYPVRMYALRPR